MNPSAAIFSIVSGYTSTLPGDDPNQCDLSAVPDLPSSSSDQSVQLNPQSGSVPPDDEMQLDFPPLLSSLYDPQLSKSTDINDLNDICSNTFKGLTITEVQAKNVFSITKGQSESTLWFEHRLGRITSSRLHAVLKYTEQKYPK